MDPPEAAEAGVEEGLTVAEEISEDTRLKVARFVFSDEDESLEGVPRKEVLAVLREIAGAIGPTQPRVIRKAADEAEKDDTPEKIILARYKKQYGQLPGDIRNRCSWEEVSSRLMAKGSHYLKLAGAMVDGGKLVHIDDKGNPVFRDGGVEPVMQGMSYNETREELYGENYEEETPHYGYEMPNREEELRAIELITGRLFVASKDGQELRATHMESGKNPLVARRAFSVSPGKVEIIGDCDPCEGYLKLGVVRLLRVKRMT